MGICGATNVQRPLQTDTQGMGSQRISTEIINSPKSRCDTIVHNNPIPFTLSEKEGDTTPEQQPIPNQLTLGEKKEPHEAKTPQLESSELQQSKLPIVLGTLTGFVPDAILSTRNIDKLVSKHTKRAEMQEAKLASQHEEDSQEPQDNLQMSKHSSEIFRLGDPICEQGPVTVYNSLDTTGRLWSMKVIQLSQEDMLDEKNKGLCEYIQQVINQSLSTLSHKNIVKYTFCRFSSDTMSSKFI